MILHQVVIRKDGPIHAIEYVPKRTMGFGGRYVRHTLCGLSLSGLEQPQRRRFVHVASRAHHTCARCLVSYQLQT